MVGKIIAILLVLTFTSFSIDAQVIFPTNSDESETEKVNQNQEDIVNSLFGDSETNEIFREDFGQPVMSRYFKMFRNYKWQINRGKIQNLKNVSQGLRL